MPEVSERGVRYPTGREKPAWPDDFERMANDLDGLVAPTTTGYDYLDFPGSGNRASFDVTFPPGLFHEPPIILATAHSSNPNNVELVSVGGNVTKTGGTIHGWRTTSVRTGVSWVATDPKGYGGLAFYDWQHPQYSGSNNTLARPSRYFRSLRDAISSGQVVIDAGVAHVEAKANEVRSTYVEFNKEFSSTPRIAVTANSTAPNNSRTTSVRADGTDGFDLYYYRLSSVTTKIYWVAFGEGVPKKDIKVPTGVADLPAGFESFITDVEAQIPTWDSGAVLVSGAANTSNMSRVEFNRTFKSDPILILSPINNGSATGHAVKTATVANQTPTGFDVWTYRSNNNDTLVNWLAVEP